MQLWLFSPERHERLTPKLQKTDKKKEVRSSSVRILLGGHWGGKNFEKEDIKGSRLRSEAGIPRSVLHIRETPVE